MTSLAAIAYRFYRNLNIEEDNTWIKSLSFTALGGGVSHEPIFETIVRLLGDTYIGEMDCALAHVPNLQAWRSAELQH